MVGPSTVWRTPQNGRSFGSPPTPDGERQRTDRATWRAGGIAIGDLFDFVWRWGCSNLQEMPARRPVPPCSWPESSATASADWSSFWRSLNGPEKRRHVELALQTRQTGTLEVLVCHTSAVREGFLFELRPVEFQNLAAASDWEQKRGEAVAEFNAAAPEEKAGRIENALQLGQFAFLRHLVRHTGCVEEGFLCEWPRGAFDQEAEPARVEGVEKAVDRFRGLADWEKVQRIRNACRWRQWGYLKELIRRTDCVSSGLLWDPPAAVVPASVRGWVGGGSRAGTWDSPLPLEGDPECDTEFVAVEVDVGADERDVQQGTGNVWRKRVAMFLRSFRRAAPLVQMERVQRLVVLKQWRTVAEVLLRDSRGTGGGQEKRSGVDWAMALAAPCPELFGEEVVRRAWMEALSSPAPEKAVDERPQGTGEARVYALQTWRMEGQRRAGGASRWLGALPTGGDPQSAAALRAFSSGFRTGMRVFGRLQPREIPPSLRCDPEVVLGEWRESWTGGTGPLDALPWGTLERLAREGGGITEWREGGRTDVPEARAVWAWAWLRKAALSTERDTPVVPASLRHIPQVLRLVAGEVLEKLDTPINRGQRRFPDVSAAPELLLNSGLWEEGGHRCAALIRWVYTGNFEIRQIPGLLRNHPALVALCGEGRIFLDPAADGDFDALLHLLSREPVPWCLVPDFARVRPEFAARFCSGWSRICERALPRAAVPQQVWDGVAAAQFSLRWARAWRKLLERECIPLHGIPAEIWNDPRARRDMLLCWCRQFREVVPGAPEAEVASLGELEDWYLRWSECWMLHPRPPAFFRAAKRGSSCVVFSVEKDRVQLQHPDDECRRDAVSWCIRLQKGGLPLHMIPERFYHVPEVIDAWVKGGIRSWRERLAKGHLILSALLEEWVAAPVFWIHAVHRRKRILSEIVDLLVASAGAGSGKPILHGHIPVWLRASARWATLVRKGWVTLPEAALCPALACVGDPRLGSWLCENPVSPAVLEAYMGPVPQPVMKACRDGWLGWARKEILPAGAFPAEFTGGEGSEALAEGWLRFLKGDRGLLSADCLEQSFPREREAPSGGTRALLELEFQRCWLRWAEHTGDLRGRFDRNLFRAVDRLAMKAEHVRTVFKRWKMAWTFRIHKDLQMNRSVSFARCSLPNVESRIRKWKDGAAAGPKEEGLEQKRTIPDAALADAIFASWVWAVGAAPGAVLKEPDFLSDPDFRELHLGGWRRVLENRACLPEGIPGYVLEDPLTAAAWRRGWCIRLAGEASSLETVPEALRSDPDVFASRLHGWERRLLEAPCSVWEICSDLRAEPQIRDAWRTGWVRRFETKGAGGELALLWPHLGEEGEVPGRSVLWLATATSSLGGAALSQTGVPPGYEEAVAAVQTSCLNWKEWFLSVCEWDGPFRSQWEASPEGFVTLCRIAYRVPPWEHVAAGLRADSAVCEAWVARHPLESAVVYELKKISRQAEGSPSHRRYLEALFDRPWAAVALPEEVRRYPPVQKAVAEGWVEKVRGNTAYRRLKEFCERSGKGSQ